MRVNLSGVDSGSIGSALPTPSHSTQWSPQQLAVFDAVRDPARGSLRIDAVAGSGKTTTLVEASRLMTGPRAFAAFNKRIADEIKLRTSGIPDLTAGTLHSFGLKAWTATAGKVEIDGDKVENIMEDLRVDYNLRSFTKAVVSMVKQAGWKQIQRELLTSMCDHHDLWDKLPDYYDQETNDPFEWVTPVLAESVARSTDLIDFDDMLYMPLNYGHIERSFNWVLLDEAQDTNWVRRELASRMLAPNGRVVAVGDPHQAIYGFTGADADALDLISSEFQCEFLPLTVTYRCPKTVVDHAHQWVSHIQAADEAPQGIVRQMDAKTWRDLDASQLTASDVVLCRFNRPLVSGALQLIRRGIGARVEGREIGQSLLQLTKRWKKANTLGKLEDQLISHRDTESRKMRAKGQAAKAAQIEDKVDSLLAVMDSLGPQSGIFDLQARINSLFGDTIPGQPPRVTTFSSIHKSKGREWNRVYLLGREQLQPARFAKQDWEKQQEANLCYVAVTRTKHELVEVEYEGP